MTYEVETITLSKGFQFTLPAKSRKKHKLKPGQKIQVLDLDNEIILRPKKKRSLKELIGACEGNKKDKKFDVVKEHDLIICGFD
jgi:AbrB family looped-hinge helix DNA binding protein